MAFGDNLKSAREKKGLSQQALVDQLNTRISEPLKRNTISNYESNQTDPPLEVLAALVKLLDTTADKLLGIKTPTYAQVNAQANAQLSDSDHDESYIKKLGTGEKRLVKGSTALSKVKDSERKKQLSESLLTTPDHGETIEHIVDTSGLSLVPILDIKAAAGGAGYINSEALTENDVIRLPSTMVKSGKHICIRIKGPSMAPTFQDGGYLVIRLLDRSEWLNMRSEYCYVIVDQEGKTYFKRIKNRFSGVDGGFIVCMSDNPDKMSHPNFNLHPNEIQYIWYVEWYFTAKMPNIHDQYYSRVSNLEDQVQLLAEEFRNIQKRLK